MMENIICPICGVTHEMNVACSQCGFEAHILLTIGDTKFQEYEQKRVADAKERWQNLMNTKANELKAKQKEIEKLVINYESEISRLKADLVAAQTSSLSAKPKGFLITDYKVVYCLYEGINSFGGPGLIVEDGHQQLSIPGFDIAPKHFSIEVTASGENWKFVLHQMAQKERSLFVNNFFDAGDGQKLRDNMVIVLANGEPENSAARLLFRKN